MRFAFAIVLALVAIVVSAAPIPHDIEQSLQENVKLFGEQRVKRALLKMRTVKNQATGGAEWIRNPNFQGESVAVSAPVAHREGLVEQTNLVTGPEWDAAKTYFNDKVKPHVQDIVVDTWETVETISELVKTVNQESTEAIVTAMQEPYADVLKNALGSDAGTLVSSAIGGALAIPLAVLEPILVVFFNKQDAPPICYKGTSISSQLMSSKLLQCTGNGAYSERRAGLCYPPCPAGSMNSDLNPLFCRTVCPSTNPKYVWHTFKTNQCCTADKKTCIAAPTNQLTTGGKKVYYGQIPNGADCGTGYERSWGRCYTTCPSPAVRHGPFCVAPSSKCNDQPATKAVNFGYSCGGVYCTRDAAACRAVLYSIALAAVQVAIKITTLVLTAGASMAVEHVTKAAVKGVGLFLFKKGLTLALQMIKDKLISENVNPTADEVAAAAAAAQAFEQACTAAKASFKNGATCTSLQTTLFTGARALWKVGEETVWELAKELDPTGFLSLVEKLYRPKCPANWADPNTGYTKIMSLFD